MPGELGNIIAGRVANLFNLRGPNYVTDAACASGLAAMAGSIEGLINREYDAVLTGGVDRNMGASTYVKFCKIGALSATGTRPYTEGADGFVMGEGGTLFVLKRLADAERDGDHVNAVLLGVAGASDGKGKGIAATRWASGRGRAGLAARGNRAVDVLVRRRARHIDSRRRRRRGRGARRGIRRSRCARRIDPLGSVKSNIGHLKGAAAPAGVFKAVMALHEKVLPPSINFDHPNPNIDFGHVPFAVNTELRQWDTPGRAFAAPG